VNVERAINKLDEFLQFLDYDYSLWNSSRDDGGASEDRIRNLLPVIEKIADQVEPGPKNWIRPRG
jgi:hypothetical protein